MSRKQVSNWSVIMDIFHDMKKHWKGKTPEGHDQFIIPLRPDEDGMIGRECPDKECQPRYFKIFVPESEKEKNEKIEKEESEELSQSEIICPYCGRRGNMQEFHTKEQIEWIKSMIERDLFRSIQDTFKKALKPSRSRTGSFLNIEFKPGRLPSVRHYIEEKLKREVACNKCGQKYAIYGIALHCPFCGGGHIIIHYERSKQIILSLLDSGDVILEKGGKEAFHHHLGNCLEDVVSLFEGFHKSLYSKAIRDRGSREEAKEKISKMKDPEYFKPILEYLKRNLNDCELYQIHEDYGYIIPFLIWANKEVGLKEEEIFDFIFNKTLPDNSNGSKLILSGEVLEILKVLKVELSFCRERNMAKDILDKTVYPQQRKGGGEAADF